MKHKPSKEEIFTRNLGLITKQDQKNLSKARVLICGAGGMGGVCAEALTRMGIGSLTLIDKDRFEAINLNRQVFSNINTIGKFKTKVLKKELLKINPYLDIRIYKEEVSEKNVKKLLKNVDIVVNAMDQMKASLALEREARKKGIMIVDAWITPFASVFVMDPKTAHWEDFLNLPSKGKEIHEFTPELMKKNLRKEVDYTFSHFNPYDYIKKDMVDGIVDEKVKRPSFVLVTWFSGLMMANEVFKIVCGYPHEDYRGVFFNQYTYEVKKGKAK